MIRNRVEEVLNNPGTALSVLLGGASGSGVRTFVQGFGNGAEAFYFIESGPLWECGIGTVDAGPPTMFNRNTVLDNSSGNNSRLNFTGAARIFNFVPASHVVYKAQYDAGQEQQAGIIGTLQTGLSNETNARVAGDQANNQFITAESQARATAITALRNSITSVDQARSSGIQTVSNALNAEIAARDAAVRNLYQTTINENNYYRQLQMNDDAAYAALMRSEMRTIPGSLILGAAGAWANNGGRYDPVYETNFFDVQAPSIAGFSPLRYFLTMTCTARNDGPAVGDQCMILRARLLHPNGNMLTSAVPTALLWASPYQYNTMAYMVRFELAGIPNGSVVRFSAERSWKEGGPSMTIVNYSADGFVVFSG